MNATIHRDAPRFHDDVGIDHFLTGVPGCYFLNRSPKREGEFFVTGLESTIAQVAQDLCSLFLPGAVVVNDVLREMSSGRLLRAFTHGTQRTQRF